MDDSTRSLILKNAFSLFCRKGYRKTTLQDIAKVSFVQTSTVSYHFGKKENLLKICMDRIFEILDRKASELSEDDRMQHPVIVAYLWKLMSENDCIRDLVAESCITDEKTDNGSVHHHFDAFFKRIRSDTKPSGEYDMNAFRVITKSVSEMLADRDPEAFYPESVRIALTIQAGIAGGHDSGTLSEMITEAVRIVDSDPDKLSIQKITEIF